jgi:protocatechuate 3,4-dioxygenase alpha subunit
MLEIWQADGQGRYAHPADRRASNVRFKGFGRCGTGTDPKSRFAFETIKPGATGDGQAPHVNLIVFMRGMLCHVFTRIYFDDEAEANARDPVLASVEEARRGTLIATRQTTPAGTVYRFDLHMQGPRETVFFDV